MALKTIEQRKLAKEQQLAATSGKTVEQEKAADDDEDEVIDPDEEYVPKPAAVKPAVVSFHDTTTNTETSEESLEPAKPTTFVGKLAAATVDQGEISKFNVKKL
jgi:hypothetical protein